MLWWGISETEIYVRYSSLKWLKNSCVNTIQMSAMCMSACSLEARWTKKTNGAKWKRIIETRRKKEELRREGTWSRNVSVPLQPATSYHRASTDKWMQEDPIIEMFRNKCLDKGEGFHPANWCVRMAKQKEVGVRVCTLNNPQPFQSLAQNPEVKTG